MKRGEKRKERKGDNGNRKDGMKRKENKEKVKQVSRRTLTEREGK